MSSTILNDHLNVVHALAVLLNHLNPEDPPPIGCIQKLGDILRREAEWAMENLDEIDAAKTRDMADETIQHLMTLTKDKEENKEPITLPDAAEKK